MIQLNPEVQVGQLVAEMPAAARIFERLGIDYCCGGRQSLSAACQTRGLEVEELLRELGDALRGSPHPDVTQLSLSQLADHIVSLHHGYLKETLPLLTRQVERVALVHGSRRPELLEVRKIFQEFVLEMTCHMEKEEQVLFPIISALEAGGSGHALGRIIEAMEAEHDSAGQALDCMRLLTDGYAIPEGACTTYRAVLQGLAELEEATHIHVHAENHILFPRALALSES
ncbi:iron-sulfur cluster repair di-iron protein [bacterium]|nr:iron-sulfur cluster repair di-iron protein [bacterium]